MATLTDTPVTTSVLTPRLRRTGSSSVPLMGFSPWVRVRTRSVGSTPTSRHHLGGGRARQQLDRRVGHRVEQPGVGVGALAVDPALERGVHHVDAGGPGGLQQPGQRRDHRPPGRLGQCGQHGLLAQHPVLYLRRQHRGSPRRHQSGKVHSHLPTITDLLGPVSQTRAMDLHVVRYEVSDRVATVTLDRPERLNAWTGRMHTEYRWCLAQAEADPAVRVVVVTGAGRGFCAGADFRGAGEERGGGRLRRRRAGAAGHAPATGCAASSTTPSPSTTAWPRR